MNSRSKGHRRDLHKFVFPFSHLKDFSRRSRFIRLSVKAWVLYLATWGQIVRLQRKRGGSGEGKVCEKRWNRWDQEIMSVVHGKAIIYRHFGEVQPSQFPPSESESISKFFSAKFYKRFCVVEPPSLINHQASFLSIKPLVLRFRDFLPVTSHLRAARYRPKCGEKTFLCCFFRDVHWSEAKQQTPMNQECYVCCYSLCAPLEWFGSIFTIPTRKNISKIRRTMWEKQQHTSTVHDNEILKLFPIQPTGPRPTSRLCVLSNCFSPLSFDANVPNMIHNFPGVGGVYVRGSSRGFGSLSIVNVARLAEHGRDKRDVAPTRRPSARQEIVLIHIRIFILTLVTLFPSELWKKLGDSVNFDLCNRSQLADATRPRVDFN